MSWWTNLINIIIMKLSSNSLFHFTSKIDNIKDILQNGFWPKYCRESNWKKDYIDFAVPMVCFCDIPLSLILEHITFYGGFGIGVSKKWILEQKTITPVQYVSSGSHEYSAILKILTKLKNSTINEAEIHKLLLAKKVNGYINKDNNKRYKKFYDEREWRHIPTKLNKNDLIIPIKNNVFFQRESYSQKTKDNSLIIPADNIQYLIIPNENYRDKLIQIINKIYPFKKEEERYRLISKIITVQQIENDF